MPLPPDGVFERVFNLRAVKRALARRDGEFTAGAPQALHQGELGFVPQRVRANALFRARGHFVDDVGEAKRGVHLLQQGRVGRAFVQDLVFGTKNVAVVLGEAAHPHDAVQGTAWLVAMALAEFAKAQGQVAVALDALLVDEDMARAIHRLERVFTLFRFGGEHVLAVFVPVAGFFPQALVQHLGAFDFLVAVFAVHNAHGLLHLLPNRPALVVPKDQARRVLVDMEQVQLAAELAVVALLGFFDHAQMVLQVFLGGPGRAVNTLQHGVAVVATPIGACHFHQLEVLEPPGAGHVRAAAQVFKSALAVQAHVFARWNAADDLGLVVLAQPAEVGDGFVARQHAALNRFVLARQLGHAPLDRRQVFWREWALKGEVVEKTVFDHRANGHLRRREQVFDRIGQQVRGGVANDLEAFGVALGHDSEVGVGVDHEAGIHQLGGVTATHAARERCLGEPGANVGCHLGHGGRLIELAFRPVGQSNRNHVGSKKQKGAERAAPYAYAQEDSGGDACGKRHLNGCQRSSRCHNPDAFLALVGELVLPSARQLQILVQASSIPGGVSLPLRAKVSRRYVGALPATGQTHRPTAGFAQRRSSRHACGLEHRPGNA